MAHILRLNAPTLSPGTSKPSPTDMGQQSFEQHFQLANKQGNISSILTVIAMFGQSVPQNIRGKIELCKVVGLLSL
jgi:hypothetical protein